MSERSAGLPRHHPTSADEWKALKDEIAESNRIASSRVAIGLREAERVIADMVSGELGGRVAQRQAGPSTGALYRA